MSNETEKRIKNVLSVVFEILAKDIDNNSSPDSIGSWDSLKHMNMVVALEEEFEIEFSDDEIIEMMNYKLIAGIVNNRLDS